MQQQKFVSIEVEDSWAKEYQVLRNRTHPMMRIPSYPDISCLPLQFDNISNNIQSHIKPQMLKKTMLLAAATYLTTKKKAHMSPEPPLSMILRGAYENKIRRFSPPEKIFDVFATISQNGVLLMTLKDLLKAICFYNYSLSDESDAVGFKPKHMIKFLGSDDFFEIYDYFLLVRFLAFERKKITHYFEENNLKEITKQQFYSCTSGIYSVLHDTVCGDYIRHIKKSIGIESRSFKPDMKKFDEKIRVVTDSFFSNRQKVSAKDIIDFRKNMIKQLYEFEFLMFPIKDGSIDGVDFARSIIKYVETNKKKAYMKRVKNMQWLQNTKIDKEAYIGFHVYMQTNIKELEDYLSQKGAISVPDLTKMINSYIKKEYKVNEDQIRVISEVLDVDGSGFLEKREVLGVLGNLEYYTKVKSGEYTFVESLKSDWEKLAVKLKKMKEIWDE